LSAIPQILACLRCSLDCRSPVSSDSGSFCYGLDPLQSSITTSRLSDLGDRTDSLEVSVPYNGILEPAPFLWSGLPAPLRFRSQAFSTSQRFSHARIPRPCFMPQPFLNYLLQSFPLMKTV